MASKEKEKKFKAARENIGILNQNILSEIKSGFNESADGNTNIVEKAISYVGDGQKNEGVKELVEIVSTRLQEYCIEFNYGFDDTNLNKLVSSLTKRVRCLPDIVSKKEEDGDISSYKKEQHEAVVNNAEKTAISLNTKDIINDSKISLSTEFAKEIIKLIADYSVELQDEYLKQKDTDLDKRTGPLARLIQINPN